MVVVFGVRLLLGPIGLRLRQLRVAGVVLAHVWRPGLIRPRVAELAEATTAEEVLPLLLDVPVVKALQDTVTADAAVTVGEEADDRVLPSDFANLDDAYLLGDPAAQPSSFGGEEAGEPAFDYWVETLSL